jgi:hypothetical protein
MDISYNRGTWFAGGSTPRTQSGRTSAILTACSLNRNLGVIRSKVLDQYGLQAVTAVKRMPSNDDLIVGGFRKLLVVNWTGMDFNVLKVVDNVHSGKPFHFLPPNLNLGLFCDIALHGNKIYSVCREDKYIAQTTFN